MHDVPFSTSQECLPWDRKRLGKHSDSFARFFDRVLIGRWAPVRRWRSYEVYRVANIVRSQKWKCCRIKYWQHLLQRPQNHHNRSQPCVGCALSFAASWRRIKRESTRMSIVVPKLRLPYFARRHSSTTTSQTKQHWMGRRFQLCSWVVHSFDYQAVGRTGSTATVKTHNSERMAWNIFHTAAHEQYSVLFFFFAIRKKNILNHNILLRG